MRDAESSYRDLSFCHFTRDSVAAYLYFSSVKSFFRDDRQTGETFYSWAGEIGVSLSFSLIFGEQDVKGERKKERASLKRSGSRGEKHALGVRNA